MQIWLVNKTGSTAATARHVGESALCTKPAQNCKHYCHTDAPEYPSSSPSGPQNVFFFKQLPGLFREKSANRWSCAQLVLQKVDKH